MYHIVQENCFREPHYDKLIETLEKLGLEYEIIKLKPFVEDIEYKTDRKDVFVWGAVKLARLAQYKNWWPGSLLNPEHDYMYYSQFYKENMFNHDSQIIKYSEDIDYPDKFFARPTKDSKAFTGKVFTKEEFLTTKGILKRNNWVKEDFNIQIAKIKPIQNEARFWVVGGKVITGSYYRVNNKYHLREVIEDDPMWNFAQEMVNILEIAPAFVIDICTSNDKYYIMEMGCINCAGFYLADLQKVVAALEEYYSKFIFINNPNNKLIGDINKPQ